MKCDQVYIGDPCYVVADDIYHDYCCSCNDPSGNGDTDGGVGKLEDGTVVCVVHTTESGDGEYEGYLVDSGQIAVVNGNFMVNAEGDIRDVPSGVAKVKMVYEDGVFYIHIVDAETKTIIYHESINTSYIEDWEDECDDDMGGGY